MAAVTDLRGLLKSYGVFSARLVPFNNTPLGSPNAIDTRILVNLVGRFTPVTIARYLGIAYAHVPPVDVSVRRVKYLQGGERPALCLRWYGERAIELLNAVEWRVGKPKFDAQAQAWARWLVYRRSSKSYVHEPRGD